MIYAGNTNKRLQTEAPVTFSTFTSVFVWTIGALSSVLARCAGTLINVNLTKIP